MSMHADDSAVIVFVVDNDDDHQGHFRIISAP